MAWEAITSLATAGVAVAGLFGFGIKQAKDKSALEINMVNAQRILHEHDIIIAEHTAKLAQNEGDFKVIDTKLDYISKAVEDMAVKLTRHYEEER